jgi:hypothetical protein
MTGAPPLWPAALLARRLPGQAGVLRETLFLHDREGGLVRTPRVRTMVSDQLWRPGRAVGIVPRSCSPARRASRRGGVAMREMSAIPFRPCPVLGDGER